MTNNIYAQLQVHNKIHSHTKWYHTIILIHWLLYISTISQPIHELMTLGEAHPGYSTIYLNQEEPFTTHVVGTYLYSTRNWSVQAYVHLLFFVRRLVTINPTWVQPHITAFLRLCMYKNWRFCNSPQVNLWLCTKP